MVAKRFDPRLKGVDHSRLNYNRTLETAAAKLFPDEEPEQTRKILDEMVMGFLAGDFDYKTALRGDGGSVVQRVFPVAVTASIFLLNGNHHLASEIYREIGRTVAFDELSFGWQQSSLQINSWDFGSSSDPENLISRGIEASVQKTDKIYDKAVKRSIAKSSPIDFEVVRQIYAKIRKDARDFYQPSLLNCEEAVRIAVAKNFSPSAHDPKIANYLRRMFWVPEKREAVNSAFEDRVNWHLANPSFSIDSDTLANIPQGNYYIVGGGLLSQDDYHRLSDLAVGLAGVLLERTGCELLQKKSEQAFEAYGSRRIKALDNYLNHDIRPIFGFNSVVDF